MRVLRGAFCRVQPRRCLPQIGAQVVPIMKKTNVTVRMTSDKIGQSLSLQAFNVMIEIPLESVRDIIRVSDREGKT